MGPGMHNGIQLYMRNKRQCDNLFPQKKMHLCFNNPRDPATESRKRKTGGLKYFEVGDVHEKEPLVKQVNLF
jgi:hypothetical protein